MPSLPHLSSKDVYFNDTPDAPLGSNLIVATKYGVATIQRWDRDNCLGWLEIPKPEQFNSRETAPPGVKCLLLTEFGRCVIGKWEPTGLAGWLPLPRMTERMKLQQGS